MRRFSLATISAILASGFAQAQTTTPLTFPVTPLIFPSTPIIEETPTTVEVALAADVLFDFDKAEIRPSAEPVLHELADIIRAKSHGGETIQGFTDALGSDPYNQRLSDRRAASVKSWLVAQEHFPAAMFSTIGFGARQPVAPNRHPDGSDDPEGRQRNRRVTVLIRK